MLDKFLEVSYRTGVEKTASRTLIDRLKDFPLEELRKLADGDETCKLAYAMDCAKEGSGDGTWLSKYTGTPLFQQAVGLEKALLQLDMEDQQLREQERQSRPQPSDTWAKRDAIQLQKRMLDLDLVMAENGVAPAEAAPEPAAAGAPAAPPAPEKGPPQAPPGAEAGPSPEDEEAAALELAAEEAAAGGGAGGEAPPKEGPPQEGPPQQAAPPKPKPKAPPKEEEAEEEPEEKEDGPKIEVKQSAAKVAAAVSAGRFLAKTASDPKGEAARAEIAKKFPHLVKEKTAALPVGTVPGVLGLAAGADKGHATGKPGSTALRGGIGAFGGAELGGQVGLMLGKEHPAAGLAGAALGGLAGYKAMTSQAPGGSSVSLKAPGQGVVARAGETDEDFEYGHMSPAELRQHAADYDAAGADVDANPGKYRLNRGIAGGLLGAGLGGTAGAIAGRPGLGALLGGLGGAAASALPKPHGGSMREEAEAARNYSKTKRKPQLDEKTAGLIGSALNAGKAAIPAIGGALSAGKNLATSAHAAGGMGQVASSFGNVAKQFAQKNPLAAAGIAGAGGLAAGKMLSGGNARA